MNSERLYSTTLNDVLVNRPDAVTTTTIELMGSVMPFMILLLVLLVWVVLWGHIQPDKRYPREVDVPTSLTVAITVTVVLQLVLIFGGEFTHDARNRVEANQGDIASQVSGQLYGAAYNHSLNNGHDLYSDCLNMPSLVCGGTDVYENVSGDFIYTPVVTESGDDLVVSVFVSGND